MSFADTFSEASDEHQSNCVLGPLRCDTCACISDRTSRSALFVANAESERIGWFVSKFPDVCVYCGNGAEHGDHLVPLPWTGKGLRGLVPVVPSCGDCNLRIGDCPVFDISSRCEVAATSLRRKYKRELKIPDRDASFYADMGATLKANLKAAESRRRQLRLRLVVLDAGGAAELSLPNERSPLSLLGR